MNDVDIVTARAEHPTCGTLTFERTRQDGRTYYRLLHGPTAGTRRTGCMTDAQHARDTIAYWTSKGWIIH